MSNKYYRSRSIKLYKLYVILLTVILISCTGKPVFDNPFDINTELAAMEDNLSIIQVSDSEVALDWQRNDDVLGSYILEKKIGEGAYCILDSIESSSSQYNDKPLNINTLYSYRLYGKNDSNTTNSITSSYTTSFAEIENFEVTQQSIHEAQLNWSHNCNYEAGYFIERKYLNSRSVVQYELVKNLNSLKISNKITPEFSDNLKRDNDFIIIAEVQANITNFQDSTVIPDQSYEYRIKSFSSYNESNYLTSTFDNEFLEPTNLTIEQESESTIQINWSDNCNGEMGYKIDKKTGSGDWNIGYAVMEENCESYLDEDIQLNDTIYYRVYAYYDNIYSNMVQNSVFPTFPEPTDLQLEMISMNTISLTWNDNNIFEDEYVIDKKINNDEWIENYITLESNIEHYEDDDIFPNNTYSYGVYAVSGSVISNKVIDIINSTIPTPSNFNINQISFSEVRLFWTDNCDFDEGFIIDKRVNNGIWQNDYAVINEDISEFYDTDTFTLGTSYEYRISCYLENYSSDYVDHIYSPYPQLISTVDTFSPCDVWVEGNYAYVSDISRFTVVDISNIASPDIIAEIITPSSTGKIFVNNNYAYVSLGSDRVKVINISNPHDPCIEGTIPDNGSAIANDCYVVDNIAYMPGYYMNDNLMIRDISDLSNQIYIVDFEVTGSAEDIDVVGDLVYLASGDLQIIDVSSYPQVIGSCNISGSAKRVIVDGNYAYVSSGSCVSKINVVNPNSPSVVSTNSNDNAYDIFVNDDYVFTCDYYQGLKILSKDNLSLQATCPNSSGYGIFVYDSYVFIAGQNDGIRIFQYEP